MINVFMYTVYFLFQYDQSIIKYLAEPSYLDMQSRFRYAFKYVAQLIVSLCCRTHDRPLV